MKTMSLLNRVRYPFIVTGIVSTCSILLLRHLVLRYFIVHVSPEDISNMQNFIQLLGVLYGIYLARLVDDTIKASDDTDLAFTQEVQAIKLFCDNVFLLSDKKFRRFKTETISVIQSYIAHVINSERFETAEGEKLIYELRRLINNRLDSKKNLEGEGRLLMLIENVDDIISTRANRLHWVGRRTPPVYWFLALVFSFLWIIPFVTFSYINEITSSTLIGGATFVITAFLLMIYDINNPRFWSLNLFEYKTLLSVVERDSKKEW